MLGLFAKLGIGALATAGATAAVVTVVAPSQPGPEQAIVAHHVDGDTFDVEVNGSQERIRLVNIDTPETKDPNRPVQCLGPEAADFLAGLLPVGSPVRLEFDKEREDRYGRTVAAAFMPDGRMVNAEIARAGFAQVITVGENDRFRPPIEQAAQEAAANKRGLHSPDVQCTFPGQVNAVSDTVTRAPKLASLPADLNSQALSTVANQAGLATHASTEMLFAIDRASNDVTWLALTAVEQQQLRDQTRSSQDSALREENALRTAAASAQMREEQAAQTAARAEADRIAKQQEAARIAQERRAALEAEREAAAAARAAERQQASESDSSRRSSTKGNPSGYTGPRCYAPGGRTWHPC